MIPSLSIDRLFLPSVGNAETPAQLLQKRDPFSGQPFIEFARYHFQQGLPFLLVAVRRENTETTYHHFVPEGTLVDDCQALFLWEREESCRVLSAREPWSSALYACYRERCGQFFTSLPWLAFQQLEQHDWAGVELLFSLVPSALWDTLADQLSPLLGEAQWRQGKLAQADQTWSHSSAGGLAALCRIATNCTNDTADARPLPWPQLLQATQQLVAHRQSDYIVAFEGRCVYFLAARLPHLQSIPGEDATARELTIGIWYLLGWLDASQHPTQPTWSTYFTSCPIEWGTAYHIDKLSMATETTDDSLRYHHNRFYRALIHYSLAQGYLQGHPGPRRSDLAGYYLEKVGPMAVTDEEMFLLSEKLPQALQKAADWGHRAAQLLVALPADTTAQLSCDQLSKLTSRILSGYLGKEERTLLTKRLSQYIESRAESWDTLSPEAKKLQLAWHAAGWLTPAQVDLSPDEWRSRHDIAKLALKEKLIAVTTAKLAHYYARGINGFPPHPEYARLFARYAMACEEDQDTVYCHLAVIAEHLSTVDDPSVWTWPRQKWHASHIRSFEASNMLASSAIMQMVQRDNSHLFPHLLKLRQNGLFHTSQAEIICCGDRYGSNKNLSFTTTKVIEHVLFDGKRDAVLTIIKLKSHDIYPTASQLKLITSASTESLQGKAFAILRGLLPLPFLDNPRGSVQEYWRHFFSTAEPTPTVIPFTDLSSPVPSPDEQDAMLARLLPALLLRETVRRLGMMLSLAGTLPLQLPTWQLEREQWRWVEHTVHMPFSALYAGINNSHIIALESISWLVSIIKQMPIITQDLPLWRHLLISLKSMQKLYASHASHEDSMAAAIPPLLAEGQVLPLHMHSSRHATALILSKNTLLYANRQPHFAKVVVYYREKVWLEEEIRELYATGNDGDADPLIEKSWAQQKGMTLIWEWPVVAQKTDNCTYANFKRVVEMWFWSRLFQSALDAGTFDPAALPQEQLRKLEARAHKLYKGFLLWEKARIQEDWIALAPYLGHPLCGVTASAHFYPLAAYLSRISKRHGDRPLNLYRESILNRLQEHFAGATQYRLQDCLSPITAQEEAEDALQDHLAGSFVLLQSAGILLLSMHTPEGVHTIALDDPQRPLSQLMTEYPQLRYPLYLPYQHHYSLPNLERL